ncbi:50S ribosomal protein L39e [Candidatus Micrarchaeota archaeon]|nr:50S ribosomal protein L39e [Candidatus Micrarchaeota archaeon]
MARNKSAAKKAVLSKAIRQNRRLPIFVIARTARKLTRNPRARSWRHRGLKLKIK